jgi:hypothetical protein
MPQSRRTPLHLLLAEAFRLQIRGDRIDRGLVVEPVVLAGVDAHAVRRVLLAPFGLGERRRIDAGGRDHELDRLPYFSAIAEVALVVTRTPITAPSP